MAGSASVGQGNLLIFGIRSAAGSSNKLLLMAGVSVGYQQVNRGADFSVSGVLLLVLRYVMEMKKATMLMKQLQYPSNKYEFNL